MGAWDNGWLIEDGKIVHVKGEQKIYERARDPETPSDQIFWTKEAAEDALLAQTDPVEFWYRKLEAGEIDEQDFVQLVGRIPARKRLVDG